VVDLAGTLLAARRAGSPFETISLFKKGVALQDAFNYDEPPAWYYPVRESLGGAMLGAGDAAGAETVFREALRRRPKNGRVLFGLIETLKAQNRMSAAAMVQQEFDAAWKGSDIRLKLADL